MTTKVEYLLYVPGRVSKSIYWSRHTTRANAIKRAKRDGKEIVKIERYVKEVKKPVKKPAKKTTPKKKAGGNIR